ncbi:lipid-A-disaccharide synthase [Campylobacter corcagiensis]|uniref:Lipid-A-disaccharide synthase n=1 Tax=Campylobacter corcagiensis TaxID=1448857 RepID=A0A7M1LHB0_9BACT|nr:lipid-A-disaccharide synthase [Campylobacter corcagiensis]QKF64069.1 lipid A disaccharide synthase [Campylobacter corcagiensis]QOQ87733.1 lipid-A-disaccharide synthase [Campylobacter corcagiensis]
MSKKLLISSLEPSANLHLGEILNHLENIEIYGIFDKKFGTPYMESREFSAMGFVEVLPLIFKAKKAIKNMVNLAKNCDVVLLIDSPAFNIPLAKALKKEKVKAKIIYYILPQVWAWKRKRVKIVEQNCDILASILPFDEKFYSRSTYVGHPLLDEIKVEKTSYEKEKILAFLPGSRKAEISRLMPIFRKLVLNFDEFRKILVIPPHLKNSQIYGDINGFEVSYSTPEALSISDFAFICSGTATLQAALIGTPFVLCYKAKSIDILIAKTFIGKRIKHVGLANIFFDFMGKDSLHEELIQNEVTVDNLLKAYKNHNAMKFKTAKDELKEYLKFGSSKNVANFIKNS